MPLLSPSCKLRVKFQDGHSVAKYIGTSKKKLTLIGCDIIVNLPSNKVFLPIEMITKKIFIKLLHLLLKIGLSEVCALLWRCRQNVVSMINDVLFSSSSSLFCLGYFLPDGVVLGLHGFSLTNKI